MSWSTGNEHIATVNGGTVIGKNEGSTVIIAKVGGQEQRCTVVVKQPAIPLDPQFYINYAVSQGIILGLNHDENYVSKGNWNPWINLSSKLTETQMKQNIRDSLQILMNEGREYFFVYCELQADKSYHMFIFFG